MKSVKLVYWHTKIENYGDLLSPYIIQKLSGCKIVHKNYFVGNWRSHLYYFLKEILHFDFCLHCDYLFPFETNIVGIGSILMFGNRKSKIWGSGFMSVSEKCRFGKVYAVRGQYSLNKLRKQIKEGYPISISENVALGDPGLLLPMLIVPSEKKHKIGIVPHFSEIEYFRYNFGDRYHIIDLRSSDIEAVTKDITSCERILSSSLHGIIVAHAYNIPALWMEYTGLESDTKGFKFRDYFSSVGISEYEPIRDLDQVLKNDNTVLQCFNKKQYVSIPSADLNTIRKSLLNVAPFPLSNK